MKEEDVTTLESALYEPNLSTFYASIETSEGSILPKHSPVDPSLLSVEDLNPLATSRAIENFG